MEPELRPWKCKVELARTASGKDTVLIRVYDDNLEVAALLAMEKREEILAELGLEDG